MDKHDEQSICVKQDCEQPHEVAIEYVVPSEIDSEDIKKLFSYFLYRAPTIGSQHKSTLSDEISHDDIFQEMTEGSPDFLFYAYGSSIDKVLQKYRLVGNSVCFDCVRAIYKKNKNATETELECFLRHIRNAIAHGRVAYLHEGEMYYIMFEDITTTGKTITARILCNKTCLEKWEKTLSKYTVKN